MSVQRRIIASWVPWLLVAVALIGFADATYLTIEHFRGAGVNCSIVHGCDVVLGSDYAEVAGVPTALLGAIFYLTMLILGMLYIDSRRSTVLRYVGWLSCVGMTVTLGLVYIQAFVLHSWCQFCLLSAMTSTILFGVGLYILVPRTRRETALRLVMATGNLGKVKEMRQIFADAPIEILGAGEVGASSDVEEDGTTLKENALKKARVVAQQVNGWVVSDDTGLFVDALDGAPGVRSSRFAGAGATDDQLVDKVLADMRSVPEGQRAARFVSVIALVGPDGSEHTFTGTIDGVITKERRGTPRFCRPYDLIFQTKSQNKTFSEMSDEEKNAISHRRQAFDQLRKYITQVMLERERQKEK